MLVLKKIESVDIISKIEYNIIDNVKRLQKGSLSLDKKRVLLKDIADALGLTVNTVSRAINDKHDISEATKEKVRRKAEEMGYIPDIVASSLRHGYTKTVGILFDNLANPYFMIMTEMIHQHLQASGYHIMIFTSFGDRSQMDIEVFNQMVSRRVDGILTFLRPTKEVAQLAIKNRLPMVVVGREGDDLGLDSFYTDDVEGGGLAAQHLYDLGHRNVAYIGVPSDIMCSTKRAEGFVGTFKELNVSIDAKSIVFMKHGENKLLEHVDKLYAKGVTAIFCFNDSIAYEIMHHLNKNGKERKIEIVGYDNIGSKLNIPVNMTSIDTKKDQLISSAVEALIKRIKDFDIQLVRRVYPVQLVNR